MGEILLAEQKNKGDSVMEESDFEEIVRVYIGSFVRENSKTLRGFRQEKKKKLTVPEIKRGLLLNAKSSGFSPDNDAHEELKERVKRCLVSFVEQVVGEMEQAEREDATCFEREDVILLMESMHKNLTMKFVDVDDMRRQFTIVKEEENNE